MTMWSPVLPDDETPKYLALAEVLARDVAEGRLHTGTRLPTHRELADRLGVTVGTITRAYGEARRRGLIQGEVGRGTYVRGPLAVAGDGEPHAAPADGVLDLSLNCPHPGASVDAVQRALQRAAGSASLAGLLRYQPTTGVREHKEVAVRWLREKGIDVSPDHVVITCGAQHAMLVALANTVRPGDTVVTEATTYPGMRALARLLDVRLVGARVDAGGLVPESFAETCRRHRPVAAYLTLTLHNPTATVLASERRDAVAETAAEHGVAVVEDDLHGFLLEDPPHPLTARTGGWYVTSLSKSVAGGMRLGYLAGPEPALRLSGTMWATTIMAPPLLAQVGATLMAEGELAAIEARRRTEAARRQELARALLGDDHLMPGSSPCAQWLWLRLPEAWTADTFAAAADRRGVRVAPASAFAVGADFPRAVRLSLAHLTREADVRHALEVVREVLDEGPPECVAGC